MASVQFPHFLCLLARCSEKLPFKFRTGGSLAEPERLILELLREPIPDPDLRYLEISEKDSIVDRGGGVLYQPLDARAAQPAYHGPKAATVYISVRIARTVPAEQ